MVIYEEIWEEIQCKFSGSEESQTKKKEKEKKKSVNDKRNIGHQRNL